MAIYAIGDIHGHYQGLLRLLDKIGYGDDDELWFVGDFVNRGPQSVEVLRFVTGLERKKAVLGNHDLALLVEVQGFEGYKMHAGASEVLQAEDGEELIFKLRQFPLLHVDEKLQTLMTHAGFYPGWTLAEGQAANDKICLQLRSHDYREFLIQVFGNEPRKWSKNLQGKDYWRFVTNAFCRMRYLNEQGELDFKAKMAPEEAKENLAPWFTCKQRCDYWQLFGHWASLGFYQHKKITCIDGGYAWGGKLIAYDVEKRKIAGKIKSK